jgi:hypothetical protein
MNNLHRLSLLLFVCLCACEDGVNLKPRPIIYPEIDPYIITVESDTGETGQGLIVNQVHLNLGENKFLVIDTRFYNEKPATVTLKAPSPDNDGNEIKPVTLSFDSAQQPIELMSMGMKNATRNQLPVWVFMLPDSATHLPSVDHIPLAQGQMPDSEKKQFEALYQFDKEKFISAYHMLPNAIYSYKQ